MKRMALPYSSWARRVPLHPQGVSTLLESDVSLGGDTSRIKRDMDLASRNPTTAWRDSVQPRGLPAHTPPGPRTPTCLRLMRG